MRQFEILQKSAEFQNVFSKLGSNEEVSQEILKLKNQLSALCTENQNTKMWMMQDMLSSDKTLLLQIIAIHL